MTLQDLCRNVYAETRDFYAEKTRALGDAANGVTVLYGPPMTNAPLLFLGLQPGGYGNANPGDLPTDCAYATAPFPLAQRVRFTWGGVRVEQSTGLNINFFHAVNQNAWNQVPQQLRLEIEEFCRVRALRLIDAMRPKEIVAIGTSVFGSLGVGNAEPVLRSPTRNLVLVRRGLFHGATTFGVVHLTGYPLQNAERNAIQNFFQSQH